MSSTLTYDPCDESPLLLWDTEGFNLDTGTFDWCLEAGGSLSDDNQIYTAVILQLFTNRRVENQGDIPYGDDPGGWFGDNVDLRTDLGETELGSLIWQWERSALTLETLQGIEDAARESLEVLVDEGLLAEVDVNVTAVQLTGKVDIAVELFSVKDERRYEARFSRVWQQISSGF